MVSWPPKSESLGCWVKMQVRRLNPHQGVRILRGRPRTLHFTSSQGIVAKLESACCSGNPLGWKSGRLGFNPRQGHLGKVPPGTAFSRVELRIPSCSGILLGCKSGVGRWSLIMPKAKSYLDLTVMTSLMCPVFQF